ncbi:hypothetical protein CC2G_003454 [Coprinopsis cinerea AmutBmut pab1-1]|nr:hypothetical protein CC2G_003454 [Coprinopsis cinerea AmutBmut pab1-1]
MQRSTRVITPQLLRDAAKGDPFKLFDLANSINRDNYSLDVLDAVLPHVEYAKLPRTTAQCNSADGERVFGVLACIAASLEYGCSRTPSLQEGTVTKLVANFDNILAWMKFAMARLSVSTESQFVRETLWSMATVLYQLCMIDFRSSDLLMGSREAVKLFLKAWTFRSKSAVNVYSTLGLARGECILTKLLHVYLSDKEGLATFLEVVLAFPGRLKLFCNAVICRIDQPPAQVGGWNDIVDISMACSMLLASLHCLHWQGVRVIVRQLRLSNYLSRSVTMLANLQQRLPLHIILCSYPRLFLLTTDPRAAEEMLDSGILTLLADALMKVEESALEDAGWRIVEDMLRAFGAYLFHPRSLAALRRALAALPQSVIDGLRRRERVGPLWEQIYSTLPFRVAGQQEVERKGLRLCDNDLHHEIWVGPHMGVDGTKTCSRCHLVAYCSRKCQSADWKARHKHECDVMRHTYYERTATNIRYRQATRAFHLRSIEDLYCLTYPKQSCPDQPEWEILTRINTCWDRPTDKPILTCRMPIHKWTLDQETKGDCPAMEERARSLVDEYVNTKAPATRLVEFVVRWDRGDRRLILLVELEPLPGGQGWKVRRSVPRVGK